MRYDDTRIVSFLAFIDDIAVDKRLCALDRGFLVHYSAVLNAMIVEEEGGTNKDKDQRVLRILRTLFTKIVY